MSEIKFACPQCSQHIVCDGGYADFGIECPGCGQKLVVPRIDPKDASRHGLVIVASSPPLSKRPMTTPATLDPWTEEQWDKHSLGGQYNSMRRTPFWAISLLATILIAISLKQSHAGVGAILIACFLGAVVSMFLLFLSMGRDREYSLLSIVGLMFAAVLGTAGLAVGILFVGCSMCAG